MSRMRAVDPHSLRSRAAAALLAPCLLLLSVSCAHGRAAVATAPTETPCETTCNEGLDTCLNSGTRLWCHEKYGDCLDDCAKCASYSPRWYWIAGGIAVLWLVVLSVAGAVSCSRGQCAN